MSESPIQSARRETEAPGLERGEPELWDLAWGRPHVDPIDLAGAIERELQRGNWDFRTRLLIRDSSEALRQYWGEDRWRAWLGRDPIRRRIIEIQGEDLGPRGFHLTGEKLVPATRPDAIREYLRELGSQIPGLVRIEIGRAISLILAGLLSRATADIDIVDEVPLEIRSQRGLLAQLQSRHGLALTHFQSHYLPAGWSQRLHSLGTFGRLEVFRVDPYDMFLCKLFSNRTKDLDDLRALRPQLDKAILMERLGRTTEAFMSESALREYAKRNWYILFGEPLPEPGGEEGKD